jgi:hypothetical protein
LQTSIGEQGGERMDGRAPECFAFQLVDRIKSHRRPTIAEGSGEDPVLGSEISLGYNLANPRIRKLYNAVTGDEIQKQAFWQAFKESATRRNQAVHKGRIITEADAKASFQAASDLVAYLK